MSMKKLMSLLSLWWLMSLPTSCLKTEVIGYEPPEQAVDTMAKKERPMPPKPPKDTTEQDGRVPIEWNPSVEDWDETDEEYK